MAATFAALDLAHVLGCVVGQLSASSRVEVFESFGLEQLTAHRNSLERGINIVEVAVGGLEEPLPPETTRRIVGILKLGEAASALIAGWLDAAGASTGR